MVLHRGCAGPTTRPGRPANSAIKNNSDIISDPKRLNPNLTLWIGSRCILVWDLSFRDSHQADPESKEKTDDQKDAPRIVCEGTQTACRLGGNEILKNAFGLLRKETESDSQNNTFVVLWRLDEHKIDHSPSFFKVCLKRDTHKRDLKGMQTARVLNAMAALSSSQRKLAQRLGHSPPPPPPSWSIAQGPASAALRGAWLRLGLRGVRLGDAGPSANGAEGVVPGEPHHLARHRVGELLKLRWQHEGSRSPGLLRDVRWNLFAEAGQALEATRG